MNPSPDTQHLDALTTAVLSLDARRRVTRLNPAAEDLLALSRRSATGQALARVLPAATALDAVLARAQAAGAPCVQRGLELAITPSQERLLDVTVSPLEDGGLLLELVDRSRESRIARDASLLETTGVTRGLVQRLAHEVKNPLGGLRGAAQLLARRLEDPEARRFTDVIIREADRLRDLVDAMLGPASPPRDETVNVHALLEHVRELVSAGLGEGVRIERAYDPSLPELRGDPDQLTQALLNLVVNACQAVGGEGRVTLRTEPQRQFTIGETRHKVVVCISVEDDGPGIPPQLAEQIFYPLVSGRRDGTGLGLAVAQELVQRHGGLIDFDSRPGHTVFRVILPLRTEETT